MDAFDGELSDVEESQATQMLLDLVPVNMSGLASPGTPARFTKSTAIPDLSPDSYSSSRNPDTLPTYNYHGLAITQTQTQPAEEESTEGSQKENLQEAMAVTEPRQTPGASESVQSYDTLSKLPASKTPNVNKAGHSLAHSRTRTPNSRTLPVSSLQSPFNSNFSEQENTRFSSEVPSTSLYGHPTSPSRPIPSQHSFAAERLRGPQGQSLTANRSSNDSSSARLSVTSQIPGLMYGYSLPRYGGPIVAHPQGNVLVESTPTNSIGSQSDRSGSQSYVEEATQILETQLNPTDEQNTEGNGNMDERNSSFGRSLIAGDYQPTPEPTQPATQLLEEGANQTYATAGPSAPQTNNTGPSSLLRHVRPENQWRYAKYQHLQNNLPFVQEADPAPSDVEATQPPNSNWEETQPTTEEDLMPPPRPRFPARSANMTNANSPSGSSFDTDDQMDVVPDSDAHQSSPAKAPMGMRTSSKDGLLPVPETKKPASRTDNVPPSDSEGKDSDTDHDEPPAKRRALGKESMSEDDVPLASNRQRGIAKTVDKGRGKGKGKAKVAPEKHVIQAKVSRPAKATRKKAEPAVVVPDIGTRISQKKNQGRSAQTRSWETGIVPSSVPEQDFGPATTSKNKGKGKGQARKGSVASSTSSRQPSLAGTGNSDQDVNDEDRAVESGDENYVNEDAETPGPSKNNKRKRGKAAAKAPVKRERKRQASPVGKLTRSAMASAKRNPNATRVFAFWKQDNSWYSGTVYCAQDQLTYIVKFDDDNEASLTVDQMRTDDLRVGDEVLYDKGSVSCDVVNVDKMARGYVTIAVCGEDLEVDLQDIRISHRTISCAWEERKLPKESIVTLLQPKPNRFAPSPSRGQSLVVNTAPERKGGTKNYLTGTGMIVTLLRDPTVKTTILSGVKASGGTVVEDLVELFCLTGEWQEGGNRWIIRKDAVVFKPKRPIRRLFLLTDEPNQKPKFLMSLALGIPCLSIKWLEECVSKKGEEPWLPYLVSQGLSEHLGAQVTQLVDAEWGTSQYHLSSIMTNTAPMKVFRGMSILCIGHEILPQPKGKKHRENSERSQEAVNSVPRVMLCMGADRVEAALSPDYASRPFDQYDYIVTRRQLEGDAWSELPRSKLASWSWVKSCLIANRLLPIPDIIEQENSQEA